MHVPKRYPSVLSFFYQLSPLVSLILLIGILSILNKEFLSINTFVNLMQQVSVVGIVSLGAMFVIITGGIDFSSGYGLAMIGMVIGTVYKVLPNIQNSSLIIILLILSAILAGMILGLVNGYIVAYLKIKPFIATLATMSIAQGFSLLIGGGNMTVFNNKNLLHIGQGKFINIIPIPFVIFLCIGCFMLILLNKTKTGVYAYAIGSNEESTHNIGVNVRKYKLIIYITAGILTGIAAFLTVSKIGMAAPSIYGTILLDAIASTIIGGTSISGGRGTVLGTMTGATIIVLVSSALTYLKIPPEMQDFFKGGVICIAIIFDAYIKKKTRI